MFWSNNFQTNDTKIKLNACFIFWLVQNFEFIYISLSNWWSKLKDPGMHTQSELFDGCGTHAYVFASYPCCCDGSNIQAVASVNVGGVWSFLKNHV